MAETVNTRIRRVLMNVAARIRARQGGPLGESNGLAPYILNIVAEELENEALNKKPKT